MLLEFVFALVVIYSLMSTASDGRTHSNTALVFTSFKQCTSMGCSFVYRVNISSNKNDDLSNIKNQLSVTFADLIGRGHPE